MTRPLGRARKVHQGVDGSVNFFNSATSAFRLRLVAAGMEPGASALAGIPYTFAEESTRRRSTLVYDLCRRIFPSFPEKPQRTHYWRDARVTDVPWGDAFVRWEATLVDGHLTMVADATRLPQDPRALDQPICAIELGDGVVSLLAVSGSPESAVDLNNALHATPNPRRRRPRAATAPRIGMLVRGEYGISVETFTMPGWEPLVSTNYEAEAVEDYKRVLDMLHESSPAGRLSILAGPPGTGKTHMLRALARDCHYTPLLVTPEVAAQIATPDFLTFLLQLRRESTRIVLFVEDADLVLRDRDQNLHGLAPLSTFLNATEGMLADVLDLRLVVTTNAEADAQLDAAVTRPGRLHTMVRVDELSQVSATRALRVLVPGADAPGRAMPLADVYAAARDLGWTPPKSAREVPRRVPDRSGIVGEFEEA